MTTAHTSEQSPESFAIWLRGFMDAIDGVPTPAQVERIRAELAKVQVAEAAAPEKTSEPVVLGKDLQKLLDEIAKYIPPPVMPTPHLPTWPPAPTPWDTQPTLPYAPWQPFQPTIIWTSDRIEPYYDGIRLRADAGVACGQGWLTIGGATTDNGASA